MSAIHTTGPWEYLHTVGSSDFTVMAWDKRYTASLIKVAYVPNTIYSGEHGWPEHNERHANARLIAAAPELLEKAEAALAACERMTDQYGDVACGVDFRALGNSLRSAIAKATGGKA